MSYDSGVERMGCDNLLEKGMKRSMPAGGCLVLLLTGWLGSALAQGHYGHIGWERDPEAGLARAKAEGRAALLYFTAEW